MFTRTTVHFQSRSVAQTEKGKSSKKNDSVVVGTCVVMMFYKHMSDKSREAVSSFPSLFLLICTFIGFGNEYFLGDWVELEENESKPERKRTLLQRSHGVRTFDS